MIFNITLPQIPSYYKKAFILFLLPITTLKAQFLMPNLTFYRQNWEIINPAALNRWLYWDEKNHQQHTITFAGRYQWFGKGLQDAPRFFNGSYEWSPEGKSFKAGATFYYDQTGAISVVAFAPSVSTSISINSEYDRYLSMGLGLRYYRYQVDVGKFQTPTPNDPVINAWSEGRSLMDVATGLFFHQVKIFYIGLSSPQMFSAAYNSQDSSQLKQRISPHVYATAGYYWKPTGYEDDGFFEFSTILRRVPRLAYATGPIKKLSMEFNTRYWFRNEKFWLGGGYSTNRMANLEFGYEFIKGEPNRHRNKQWRDRIGIVWTNPAGRLAAPFGYQIELAYSHAWY